MAPSSPVSVIFRRVGRIAKSDTVSFVIRLSVCLSISTEQLGSHWTDFHEVSYLSIFRKRVEKIQVSLKSDKKNGYFT